MEFRQTDWTDDVMHTNAIGRYNEYLRIKGYNMNFPPSAQNYLIKALKGTPTVLERLVKDHGPEDPIWDFSPDPLRFSLREVVAHLADWEPIWLERFTRANTESRPFLPSVDEGQLAITGDYKHRDPVACVAAYKSGRIKLVSYLESLGTADWNKIAEREFVGPLTIQMMATYVLSHDGYHLAQVVEWLEM